MRPPGKDAPPDAERIAKRLARAGVASRRAAEVLIAEGRVRVNGRVVSTAALLVEGGDRIEVDGAPITRPERTRLFRYHKPRGLLTTHRDPEGRPTVFQRLPAELGRLVSVGRLDLDSEGLLLLTNDGALARRLELPSSGLKRAYRARVFGPVDEAALASLAHGVEIEGVRYRGIEAGLDSRRGDNAWLSVTLQEGKNREIRRVMEWLGLRVGRLLRTGYGPFTLGELARGAIEEVPVRSWRSALSGVLQQAETRPPEG